MTIHNWIQKTELQPTDEKRPDHIVLDETVIQLDDQRYWPYAAVDPETNEYSRVALYATRTTARTGIFLRELREKHAVADTTFSSIQCRGSKMHPTILGSDFDAKNVVTGTPSNVSTKE